MATETDWVLVRYVGEQEFRLGMVQALPRTKWDYLLGQHPVALPLVWELIAKGTQEEMNALRQINRS